ncbi:L-threonylcarbamoyladenylate synthase [bacterium]|nr:L-threonylcarbamoyladenylate synthase [bacterium]
MAGINILKLDETARAEVVTRTAEVLLSGGIVIFPTDTVYGLMVHGTDAQQLARLNALKGRSPGRPIAALAAPGAPLVEHMHKLVGSLLGAVTDKLIPGALTVVADRAAWGNTLPEPLMSLPYSRIGVRIPGHAVLQEILARCGGWLMATSANPEGQPTQPSLREVIAQLGGASGVELAVDGGLCESEPSAVVEISGGQIRIARPNPLLGTRF